MKDRKKNLSVLFVVGLLALIGCGAGNLDQGQVKYTPGVPPWKETDPAKKGPGGISSGGTGGGQANSPGAPATDPQGNTTAPPPGGGPPGMTAPTRSSGK